MYRPRARRIDLTLLIAAPRHLLINRPLEVGRQSSGHEDRLGQPLHSAAPGEETSWSAVTESITGQIGCESFLTVSSASIAARYRAWAACMLRSAACICADSGDRCFKTQASWVSA